LVIRPFGFACIPLRIALVPHGIPWWISDFPQDLSCGPPSAQNKANFKMGKIDLSLYCEKPYDHIAPHSCLAMPENKPNPHRRPKA